MNSWNGGTEDISTMFSDAAESTSPVVQSRSPLALAKKKRRVGRPENRTSKDGKKAEFEKVLTDSWNGASWTPNDVSEKYREHRGYEISKPILGKLVEVTRLAENGNIPLNSLWQPRGALRVALSTSESGVLSVPVCRKAVQLLKTSINNRTAERHFISNGANGADDEYIIPDSTLGNHLPLSDVNVEHEGETSNESGPPSSSTVDIVSKSPNCSRTQGGVYKKKRKRSDIEVIDLESCPDARPSSKQTPPEPPADKARRELTDNLPLSDDSRTILCAIMIRKYIQRTSQPPKAFRLVDPLWFQGDEKLGDPQIIRSFSESEWIYFPIHYRSIQHWVLMVLRTSQGTIHCHFFDSLPDEGRAGRTKARLERWIERYQLTFSLNFQSKPCAQQGDGVNCGVFVLTFLQCHLESRSVPQSITPSREREKLLHCLLKIDSPIQGESSVSCLQTLKGPGDTEQQGGDEVRLATEQAKGIAEHVKPEQKSSSFLKKLAKIDSIRLEDVQEQIRGQEKHLLANQAALEKASTALYEWNHEARAAKITNDHISRLILNAQRQLDGELADRSASIEDSQKHVNDDGPANRTRHVQDTAGRIAELLEHSEIDGMNKVMKELRGHATDIETQLQLAEASVMKYQAGITKAETILAQWKGIQQIKESVSELDIKLLDDFLDANDN